MQTADDITITFAILLWMCRAVQAMQTVQHQKLDHTHQQWTAKANLEFLPLSIVLEFLGERENTLPQDPVCCLDVDMVSDVISAAHDHVQLLR